MNREQLEDYLGQFSEAPVEIERTQELGAEAQGAQALKAFGFGRPLLVVYRAGGERHQVVVHRMQKNAFGREMAADLAAAVWLDRDTFNELPRHVPALDMAARYPDGALQSLGDVRELVLVTGFEPGQPYAEDLLRLREGGELRNLDVERARALASYLAGVHVSEHDSPDLWRRRLRDLVGHGEGIMGQTETHPRQAEYVNVDQLRWFEDLANGWRWRLMDRADRLRQVHGDFHPFNVIFREGLDFSVLDRSRGPWGEPADDVSAMSVNYIFFSLQRAGRLEGAFEELHREFWASYLEDSEDRELPEVVQPWLAWRLLVLASPVWYPDIEVEVRRKLLTMGMQVLKADRYEFEDTNSYLEAGL